MYLIDSVMSCLDAMVKQVSIEHFSVSGIWFGIRFFHLSSCFFFGLLTLHNLRQRRKIAVRLSDKNQVTRRTDTQLLRMLTAQVLLIIVFTLSFSIYRLYSTFTVNLTKSTLRIAQENLAFQIVGAMTYFAHSSSFYLYTLSGTLFRKEFIKIINRYRDPNRNSTLQPVDVDTFNRDFTKK